MIENQYNSQPLPIAWAINDFNKEKENQRVIRKFINSAIYVEKAVTEIPPSRKTSPLSIIDNKSDVGTAVTTQCPYNLTDTCKSASKILYSKAPKTYSKIKSCAVPSNASNLDSSSDQGKTLCHESSSESGYRTNGQSSNRSSIETSEYSSQSRVTVKLSKDFKTPSNPSSELRLSLTYLNSSRTDRTSMLDPKEKEEIVQNWLAKKQLEKKSRTIQEAKLLKQKEEDRQKLIEKERETFKKWLAEKKKEEERKKLQKRLEEQELKVKQADKEKKKVENEINFNLWLRRKKKHDLERKIREKIALLHVYEEKQTRMEENEIAYQIWIKNASSRPKPIPMNRGLQSLCSSASITYINPQPWTPNIDQIPKSSSQ